MTIITAADFAEVEYKGFTIQPYYDLKALWCTNIFDETGELVREGESDSTPQEAIDFAKELINTELAKRSIAPQFLALLQQSAAEGYTAETIAWALIEGSKQYSERGFFSDSNVLACGY